MEIPQRLTAAVGGGGLRTYGPLLFVRTLSPFFRERIGGLNSRSLSAISSFSVIAMTTALLIDGLNSPFLTGALRLRPPRHELRMIVTRAFCCAPRTKSRNELRRVGRALAGLPSRGPPVRGTLTLL